MSDEKKIEDGGPVFPTRGEALLLPAWIGEKHPDVLKAIEKLPMTRPGLTLREAAALTAMHALLAGPGFPGMGIIKEDPGFVPAWAFAIADEFIKQRKATI